jgi:transposase
MLSLQEWKMIRELKQSGLTISEISKRIGADRKTIRSALLKNACPKYQRIKSHALLDDFKTYIETRLEKYNLTSQKIFEEITTQGYLGKYGMVNKCVQKYKYEYKSKATLRFETIPGEQSQVDWAYFGDFYDQDKRKIIRLCCFIMVLGYSRTRFIYFFDSDNTSNFLKGHNLAFTYFGGYSREILYDNLKSVVIKRAFKQIDSDFNKEFLEFSGFYGFKAVLAQPYRPQTKGKVEKTVRFVRDNFFNGSEFKSLAEVNAEACIWINKVNNQIHHTTHEKPSERLLKENLIPIIGTLYDLSKIYYRKVQMDCHFSFRANFYSCKPEFAGKEVVIKEIDNHIYIYYRNERIGIHKLVENCKGSYLTCPSHYLEIKLITEKQSSLAWRNKKLERNSKKKNKEKVVLEYHRSNFNSGQVIKLFQDVEKRDLNIYEEIVS